MNCYFNPLLLLLVSALKLQNRTMMHLGGVLMELKNRLPDRVEL